MSRLRRIFGFVARVHSGIEAAWFFFILVMFLLAVPGISLLELWNLYAVVRDLARAELYATAGIVLGLTLAGLFALVRAWSQGNIRLWHFGAVLVVPAVLVAVGRDYLEENRPPTAIQEPAATVPEVPEIRSR